MWADLWQDFEDRAVNLINGGEPVDAVDHTIRWQLDGQAPHVQGPILPAILQLPEIYSGSPWLTGAPGDPALRWIAFVTINPGINPLELYPTRAHLPPIIEPNAIAQLISYFDTRFAPEPLVEPLLHGRHNGRPVVWVNGDNPDHEYQPTWGGIDNALHGCMAANGIAGIPFPLGQRAAIIDVVPWKFNAWSRVPEATKNQLIEAGSAYCHWILHRHPPTLIVAAGMHALIAMQQLFPELPPYAPNQLVAVGAAAINGALIPWRGVPHPVAFGNRFGEAMNLICADVAAVLAA